MRAAVHFLRFAIVLLGVGAMAFLLWEPQTEGRNVGAGFLEIYFKDPFLAYAYTGSIPFFVGLYQAFRFLGCAERNQANSVAGRHAVRMIRYCAFALLAFAALGIAILFVMDSDDRAGGVFIGVLIAFSSAATAAAAVVFEAILDRSAASPARAGDPPD